MLVHFVGRRGNKGRETVGGNMLRTGKRLFCVMSDSSCLAGSSVRQVIFRCRCVGGGSGFTKIYNVGYFPSNSHVKGRIA